MTTRGGYAGAEWLREWYERDFFLDDDGRTIERPALRKVSDLGAAVADIIGDTFAGLYHLREVYDVDWSNARTTSRSRSSAGRWPRTMPTT